jgi:iron complex transport system permease protein
MKMRIAIAFTLWLAVLPASALLALLSGSSGISSPASLLDPAMAAILTDARLPRVIAAAVVGAALSAAGSALQGIMRNPLAEPFVLGVSGGAALGGTAAIALGLNMSDGAPWVVLLSFAAAVATTLLLSLMDRMRGGASIITILLTGVVFNAFAAALITFVKFLLPVQRTQQLGFWLSGSLGYESWSTLAVVGGMAAAGVAALAATGHRLNVLSLGDSVASSLGVEGASTRRTAFLLSSLLTAAAVSLSGLVGFVGLIVPQALRVAVTPDQRFLIPASAAVGASFLMLCDAACRTLIGVIGSEPPLGALTAIMGGPLFIVLLRKFLKGPEGA